MPMGQTNIGTLAYTLTPRGYESINLADGLVHTITAPATGVAPFIVMLEGDGGALRYRDDGVAPTNVSGFRIADGGVLSIQVDDLADIQLIRDAADTGTVNVLIYTYASAGEA